MQMIFQKLHTFAWSLSWLGSVIRHFEMSNREELFVWRDKLSKAISSNAESEAPMDSIRIEF